MMANQQLIFADKSYCFTGKLAELKRTQAEREVRARGGLTTETVNERLDYLVIGSIPAIGWKHGSYGNKIEKARKIASDRNSKGPFGVRKEPFGVRSCYVHKCSFCDMMVLWLAPCA